MDTISLHTEMKTQGGFRGVGQSPLRPHQYAHAYIEHQYNIIYLYYPIWHANNNIFNENKLHSI